jgi:hypothetical protein
MSDNVVRLKIADPADFGQPQDTRALIAVCDHNIRHWQRRKAEIRAMVRKFRRQEKAQA